MADCKLYVSSIDQLLNLLNSQGKKISTTVLQGSINFFSFFVKNMSEVTSFKPTLEKKSRPPFIEYNNFH